MQTSIQLCKFMGIPIRLHFTFLFIFFAIIFSFANWPQTETTRIPLGLGGLELSLVMRYTLSTIAAVLFFFTLLLHEMAHSFVAMRFGTKIHSITLFFFGGLAMMEDIPRSPDKEWRIAIAGPLMSLALGGLFSLFYLGLKALNSIYRPVAILVLTIGFFNGALAVFNLLPAFPMDGGRILRALLAKRMTFLKATRRAAFIGKLFAFALVIMGFSYDPFTFILTGKWSPNLWLPLLAIFLFMAATEEERATATFAILDGIKVKNVMRTERTTVPEDITLSELVNAMLTDKITEYAVVDARGDLKGFVTLDAVKKIPYDQRYFLHVSDVMIPYDGPHDALLSEAPASEALKRMLKDRKSVLAVIEEAGGELIGIITKKDLSIYIEMLRGGAGAIESR
ncbi:MAG: site-2 protease family protein [Methanophagales archaeon]|nr:site-2 protease family protein [Methanophagales archaeon]